MRLSIVLKLATETVEAQSNDGAGAAEGPEHAGVFDPSAADGPASGIPSM